MVKLVRKMCGQVGSATVCYRSSLGSNPDISPKKYNELSKEWPIHSRPPKKYTKKKLFDSFNQHGNKILKIEQLKKSCLIVFLVEGNAGLAQQGGYVGAVL